MLLAEDSRADALLVRDALEQGGLHVDMTVKRDGREALDLIDQIEAGEVPCPDVVLLDLNLPRHTGAELLERIRRGRICGQVPIIIISSSNEPKDRQMAERLRATAYFHKPSDYDQFMLLGQLVRGVTRVE